MTRNRVQWRFHRWRVVRAVLCLLLAAVALASCDRPSPVAVEVTFEVQAIGGSLDSWWVGTVSRNTQTLGFGGEAESEKLSMLVGEVARAWAVASPWSGQTSVELVCRIVVRGEEIYVDGDEGSQEDPARVDCQGPVYLPSPEESPNPAAFHSRRAAAIDSRQEAAGSRRH
jgi:hypothetical protein